MRILAEARGKAGREGKGAYAEAGRPRCGKVRGGEGMPTLAGQNYGTMVTQEQAVAKWL